MQANAALAPAINTGRIPGYSDICDRYAVGDILNINNIRYAVCEIKSRGISLLRQDIDGAKPEVFSPAKLRECESSFGFRHNSGLTLGILPTDPRLTLASAQPVHLLCRTYIKIQFIQRFNDLHACGKIKRRATLTGDEHRLLRQTVKEDSAKYLENLDRHQRLEIEVEYFGSGSFPSARTIRDWAKRYSDNGALSLVRKLRSDSSRRSMSDAALWVMVRNILKYQCRSRPRPCDIIRWTKDDFGAINRDREANGLEHLKCPSDQTIRSEIKKLDPFQTCLAREGMSVARARFGSVYGKLLAARPGQIVIIDEVTLDVHSLKTAPGLKDLLPPAALERMGWDGGTGRLHLTVAIDVKTRVILAAHISEHPGAASAVATLQMIMTDKSYMSELFGLEQTWHMHCRPEIIYPRSTLASTRFRGGGDSRSVVV
ncbi:hypothetical protein EP867_18020, partial [Falsigemmobacter intermedius]